MQRLKDFFRQESGVVSAEYVIMVAVLGIVAAAGIWALWGALGDLFGAYASYFQAFPSE
jgi:Flp pilus assembly pilin Flp